MPSATTAHRSDSMAARRAIVVAGATSSPMCDQSICGMEGAGRPCGISPKRDPIVSTPRPQKKHTKVEMMIATTVPGT
jgi:hypothetical protein